MTNLGDFLIRETEVLPKSFNSNSILFYSRDNYHFNNWKHLFKFSGNNFKLLTIRSPGEAFQIRTFLFKSAYLHICQLSFWKFLRIILNSSIIDIQVRNFKSDVSYLTAYINIFANFQRNFYKMPVYLFSVNPLNPWRAVV